MGGLRQVAKVAACGPWPVEPALTGIDAGRLNASHGGAPAFGKANSLSVYLPHRFFEFSRRYEEAYNWSWPDGRPSRFDTRQILRIPNVQIPLALVMRRYCGGHVIRGQAEEARGVDAHHAAAHLWA